MSSSSSPTADRNLLFGVLALQMNFVTRDALVAAMHAWALDKAKPLGQILLEQGQLTPGQFQALETLMGEHLRAHGTPLDSLRSLAPDSVIRTAISDIDDPDLVTCLLGLPPASSAGDGVPGREGGRYRVLRWHAGGGLGEVFLAEDTELHREVALKEIREEYADDPARRHRFVLEAEVTGGLEHPGIVPVYGLGVYADGRPLLRHALHPGQTLREAIDAFHAAEKPGRDPGERRLAFRALLGRFIDVCNAVAYAHSRGVLHRDLKPANVMLGRFGETLVVDWGLAKAGVEPRPEDGGRRPSSRPCARRRGAGRPAPATGAALGTPGFMSPEQASGDLDALGPASDIYSLGAMLYVLLTGKRPFAGATCNEVLAQTSGRAIRRAAAGEGGHARAARGGLPPRRWPSAGGPLRARRKTSPTMSNTGSRTSRSAPTPSRCRPGCGAGRGGTGRRWRPGWCFLVCAAVGLATSTALVWREQQKTAAERRRAEENYDAGAGQDFESLRVLGGGIPIAAEPEVARDAQESVGRLGAGLPPLPRTAARRPELRERTADVYRYAANAHRLVRELDAAETLYADAVNCWRRWPRRRLESLDTDESSPKR